ncbi:hypothetical protein KO500_07215 [Cellulophaga baltica]|uniref:hypothetical protein n=1 Tax=Cellulophaga TaxID=104264 RepID=UPI001C064DBD|nr:MULTISPECIES: hypothetical protein [Cellulophaga]MBU2996217.1 hypothetical protein [Cellulophaga baltica]MDO6767612.1 hypothetical protein [Cellulophaga sp. 1_MG-2023]
MIKLLLPLLFLFSFNSSQEIDWNSTYTQATYALNHSKKALKSNNFDHQRHYSEKALEAYDKIASYLELHSDEELKLKIQNTINDLEHAVDAPDWDRGRFYSKRVYENTQDFITTLDLRAEKESIRNNAEVSEAKIIE